MNKNRQTQILAELSISGRLRTAPSIHCTVCGRDANKQIKVVGIEYDQHSGKSNYYIEAYYRCTKFPHKLFCVAVYRCFVSTQNTPALWVEKKTYD